MQNVRGSACGSVDLLLKAVDDIRSNLLAKKAFAESLEIPAQQRESDESMGEAFQKAASFLQHAQKEMTREHAINRTRYNEMLNSLREQETQFASDNTDPAHPSYRKVCGKASS